MWLAVASQDGEAAARLVFEQWGQDVDLETLVRSQSAIDLNSESASCPACGTSFATSKTRCPGCGLRFG